MPGDYSSHEYEDKAAWKKMKIIDSVLGGTQGVQRRNGNEAIRKVMQSKVKFYALTPSNDQPGISQGLL